MAGAPGESGEAVRHSDVALLRARRLVLLLAGLTVALYLGGVFHYLRTDQASRLEGLESLARDKVDSAAENVKATLNLFDFALRNARIAVLSGPDELEFQARLIMDTLPGAWSINCFMSALTDVPRTLRWGRRRRTTLAIAITTGCSRPRGGRGPTGDQQPRAGAPEQQVERPGGARGVSRGRFAGWCRLRYRPRNGPTRCAISRSASGMFLRWSIATVGWC